MLIVCACQHEVRRLARTITANQHRNLLVRQAAFGGLSAPLAGCSGKPAFLAFITIRGRPFHRLRRRQTTASPAANWAGRESGDASGMRYCDARRTSPRSCARFDLRSSVARRSATCLLPQACQRRSGQGVEGGMTCAAAIALQSSRLAPTRNLLVLAMRTDRRCAHSAFYQRTRLMRMTRRTQLIRQYLFLMRRQLLKLHRQPPKFFRFHETPIPLIQLRL